MTDFRALCAELLLCMDQDAALVALRKTAKGEPLDGPWRETIRERARAALAQPEPQGPTDGELDELFTEIDQNGESESWRPYARAVLARWGRTAIEPVPVAERLPGPEDCDAEGRCFVWDWLATEWRFLERNVFEYGWEDAYWLPHHALPVPQQEADRD